jgi:Zn-dependent metalloprotease
MKRRTLFAIVLELGLAGALSAQGIPLADEARQFIRVQHARVPGTVNPPPEEPPRITLDADGHLRHAGAAPGFHFPVEPGLENQPVAAARQFLLGHRRLFGLSSPATDLVLKQSKLDRGRNVIRLDQTYAGLPVFGGQALVHIGVNAGISTVFSKLARDLSDLDAGRVPLTPTISRIDAVARIQNLAAAEAPNQNVTISPPVLMIFAPPVLGQAGPPRLVWDIMAATEASGDFQERVLLDAHNGELVRRYPLRHTAKNREIHDAQNSFLLPGPKVRDEGDPPTGDAEVDNAFKFAGDTYDFYKDHHGRDGIDDQGGEITVSVRYCPLFSGCPYQNAYWSSFWGRMVFGANMVADDVMAHELTHGVTDKESSLIYENASGAINESISDVFGEFVDLENTSGTDSASVRWLIGEDALGGAIRDMADPTQFGHPDRLGSPLFTPAVGNPNQNNDLGGVHSNSGVNNKLAYLLTDGDSFNGQTVAGLGLNQVADLYYEANVNLLTQAADWTDLYDALNQAAVNLGWSGGDRNNLYRACLAVEIASASQNIRVDVASTCPIPAGGLVCNNSMGGPYPQVAVGNIAARPGDHLLIHGGTYNETRTFGTLRFDKLTELRSYSGTATIK